MSAAPSKVRLWAVLPVWHWSQEQRVRITSRAGYGGKVYVQRLVQTTNKWSTKRWLINESSIRREEVA